MKTKESKMSKAGWPLGKYPHRLGATDAASAKRLVPLLMSRFSLGVVMFVPYAADPRYGELTATARLSMERYGNIRAFVEGFNANRF